MSAECAIYSICGNTASFGGFLVLVFVGADFAAAVIWEAEVFAHFGDAVEFARRDVVAHAIDLVVVEPERLVLGVEIHAAAVADASDIGFAVLAVAVHADDAADTDLIVEVHFLRRKHVGRLAKRNVEFVVRSDAADACGVVVALFVRRDEFALLDDRNAATSAPS